MSRPRPVSVHGGHSGEFCAHAKDTLEGMVLAYMARGFAWVGITEHMPPVSDDFLYPEEKAAGLTAKDLSKRVADYMTTCRRLQEKYAASIRIFVGFETEDYTGSRDYTRRLIREFTPDYVVGSVHHVRDVPFDYSPKYYAAAATACGGMDALYAAYFDQQYEMLDALRPAVVGHLDIIRIYDADYRKRLTKPRIWDRVERNLKRIKEMNLILDFNLRPLHKGAPEPYLTPPILRRAGQLGIDVVPGDDSHQIMDIGMHMDRAIQMLEEAGISPRWRKPVGRLPEDLL